MYDYKMVQIPADVIVKSAENGAADYLEKLVNKYASKGWEFYRVDTLGATVQSGFLGNKKQEFGHFDVVTFRKPK